jgi:twitching motility protein PilT
VTIEDPIEFIHRSKRSVITQRELGADTRSFGAALKHALRQDPDTIMVGEMRDLETAAAALTAAETGHLVLSSLHAPSTPQTVDRIIDLFPPHQQHQVRAQLSAVLEGVLYQVLMSRADGTGVVVAVEIMLATPAVRNLIREGKTALLLNAIQTGAESGMRTLDQALLDLCRRELIEPKEALPRCVNSDDFRAVLYPF